jgi:hemin uptake protein HemP
MPDFSPRTDPPPCPEKPDPATPAPTPAPSQIDSAALLAGSRELLIRHGDSVYRLRITSTNKLILTK